MFINKDLRNTDKELMGQHKLKETISGKTIIDVQVENENDIYSSYNYERQDMLNPDFAEFLWHKAKLTPVSDEFQINIYTKTPLEQDEVQSAIKNYYKTEYIETKTDIKRTSVFALITCFLGLVAILALIMVQQLNSYIVNTIIEIAAWVFVWEAVDSIFFKKMKYKNHCIKIQKLYKAEVEIINIK